MTSKDFQDRLQSIITEITGDNQRKFADLIGTSPQNVNNWFNLGRFPSDDALAAIRDKCNINLNWLITGIGPRYQVDTKVIYAEHANEATPAYGYSKDEQEKVDKLIAILRGKNKIMAKSVRDMLDFAYSTRDHTTGQEMAEEGKKIA